MVSVVSTEKLTKLWSSVGIPHAHDCYMLYQFRPPENHHSKYQWAVLQDIRAKWNGRESSWEKYSYYQLIYTDKLIKKVIFQLKGMQLLNNNLTSENMHFCIMSLIIVLDPHLVARLLKKLNIHSTKVQICLLTQFLSIFWYIS